MRMDAQRALELQRLAAGRCPIHVRRNPACSICARIGDVETVPMDAVELEASLQEEIEAECRRRLWPFVRTRMNKATTFTFPGVPDFVIALNGGRVLWVECKSKTGKQTHEQIGFQTMLEITGHSYHLIRSFSEFRKAVNQSISVNAL